MILAGISRQAKAAIRQRVPTVSVTEKHVVVIRKFSSAVEPEPILNAESLQQKLQNVAPSMAAALTDDGYWTNISSMTGINHSLLTSEEIRAMRNQSIALGDEGRFEQSWSESINKETGLATRFDKEGVFACEPDGGDYYTAPDLLLYMSTVIGLLPQLLNDTVNNHNDHAVTQELNLSNQSFNAKLAVTSPGGSVYPLHVDNTFGVTGSPNDDTRKLTCIVYLNPDYSENDGGELRLLLNDNQVIDLDPRGGRMVMFWSDEIPHEVLPCAPGKPANDPEHDRYALTVWIPDLDVRNIQTPGSKFEALRADAFPKK
jgi:hypothetical protein